MSHDFLATDASMTTKGFTEPKGIDVPYEYREAFNKWIQVMLLFPLSYGRC